MEHIKDIYKYKKLYLKQSIINMLLKMYKFKSSNNTGKNRFYN